MSNDLAEKLSKQKEALAENALVDSLGITSSLLSQRPFPSIITNPGLGFSLKNSSCDKTDLGMEFKAIMIAGEPKEGVSRAFFSTKFDGSFKTPDCSSDDGLTPLLLPGRDPISDSCTSCTKNPTLRRNDTNEKMCHPYKTIIVGFLDNPSNHFLAKLRVGGESIVKLNNYIMEFEKHDVAIWKVFTNFSIPPESQYPLINFSLENFIDPESHVGLSEFIKANKEIIQAL